MKTSTLFAGKKVVLIGVPVRPSAENTDSWAPNEPISRILRGTRCCWAGRRASLLTRASCCTLLLLACSQGAFTPGCSATHLPGFIEAAAAIKAKGVDEIVCVSVNDPFVMAAWGKDLRADGKVRMLADTQVGSSLAGFLSSARRARGSLSSLRSSPRSASRFPSPAG